jgi:REP element-mobilizing transposase RayT
MANTYTQLTFQAVFAVWKRDNCIDRTWRDQLHRYLSGILTKEGMKSLAVGGWVDHVHLLFGMPPTRNLSDVVRVVKASSSKWINAMRFVPGTFRWQEGFGGFSYSINQRDAVIKYIMNQEEHHGKTTFRQEYEKMLLDFEIETDQRYLFEYYD